MFLASMYNISQSPMEVMSSNRESFLRKRKLRVLKRCFITMLHITGPSQGLKIRKFKFFYCAQWKNSNFRNFCWRISYRSVSNIPHCAVEMSDLTNKRSDVSFTCGIKVWICITQRSAIPDMFIDACKEKGNII